MTDSSDTSDISEAIEAELIRLGLFRSRPNMIFSGEGAVESYLKLLRSLPVGATWSDIDPRLTPDGHQRVPTPYRPYGPWDYQTPPQEPVFHLIHDTGAEGWIAELLTDAARDGIPFYGGGPLDQGRPTGLGPEHGFFVVERGILESEDLDAIIGWLYARPHIQIAARPR